jgi:hypothetical protein
MTTRKRKGKRRRRCLTEIEIIPFFSFFLDFPLPVNSSFIFSFSYPTYMYVNTQEHTCRHVKNMHTNMIMYSKTQIK